MESPLKIHSSNIFDRLLANFNLDYTLQMLRGLPLWVGFCGCEQSIQFGVPLVEYEPVGRCPFCGESHHLMPIPPIAVTTENGKCRVELAYKNELLL